MNDDKFRDLVSPVLLEKFEKDGEDHVRAIVETNGYTPGKMTEAKRWLLIKDLDRARDKEQRSDRRIYWQMIATFAATLAAIAAAVAAWVV